MPHILLAGPAASKPKSNPFPSTGNPRATIEIDVDGCNYLIVGHGLTMADIEALMPGDPVSMQGDLIVEISKIGAITGLHIKAKQVLALRRRSVNRAPIAMGR